MDIEQIKVLRHSLGWKELEVEIDKIVDAEVVKLKIAQPTAIIRLQERIRALEALKQLPEDIIIREQ